ncbi:MAG: LacI family DNA-binding transcriptional regulator, partial [Actinomycetota bacterium]
MTPVTIKDVARRAGVSTATVSRVLSGKDFVSEQMRERVLAAVERLGYRPNALARALREENTKTLGLVIGNVMNPFFTTVARAVEDAARERGYTMLLGNVDEDPGKEESYLRVLLEKRVDGIIISPARAESPHLAKVVSERVPVVFVDRSVEGIGAPVVRADGRRAVNQLVRYLVSMGHKRLSIISGPPDVVSGRERLDNFVAAAAEHGAPVDPEYVKIGDFRRQSGMDAMRELLRLGSRPTAV